MIQQRVLTYAAIRVLCRRKLLETIVHKTHDATDKLERDVLTSRIKHGRCKASDKDLAMAASFFPQPAMQVQPLISVLRLETLRNGLLNRIRYLLLERVNVFGTMVS